MLGYLASQTRGGGSGVCVGQLRARRREVEVLMARCFSRSRRVTAVEPQRTLAAVWAEAEAEGANMDGLSKARM